MNSTRATTPLCIDLDGTLLHTDILLESFLLLIKDNPFNIFRAAIWLLHGRAHLKRQIALRVGINPPYLPYNESLIDLLKTTEQRPRVLCTATDELIAQKIADHLGLFEQVIGSDGLVNMSGKIKAKALTACFGEKGFDYAGNSTVDLHIWQHARKGWVINAPRSLSIKAKNLTQVIIQPAKPKIRLGAWPKTIRIHQWLKNLLVFVPLLAAHQFLDPLAVSRSLLAFFSFSLCASGVYILNDLLDLPADRQHPRKRLRAFASGQTPLLHGMLAAPLLTLTGFVIAWWCNPKFAVVLALYYAITLAYSLYLKRVEMLDVAVLAALYTIRIIGGAVAIAVPLSFWLLAFSMFIFLSLAMLKRYIELGTLQAAGQQQANGRGYAIEDRSLLQSLGGASGYIAVLVLALYINSPESLELYARPQVLWLLCPMLLYWISRAWSVAHRGKMDDDPVVFAATDRNSQAVMGLCLLIVLGAM